MRQLFFIITLMMSITTFAQTSDEGRISIQAMMPDGGKQEPNHTYATYAS